MKPENRDRSPLPSRVRHSIRRLEEKNRSIEIRFRLVLKTIMTTDRLTAAQSLAKLAHNGTRPGTIEWAYTSEMLSSPKVQAFCEFCGHGLYGSPPRPQPQCPLSSFPELMACETAVTGQGFEGEIALVCAA